MRTWIPKRRSMVSVGMLLFAGQTQADSSGQGLLAGAIGGVLAVGSTVSFAGLGVFSSVTGNSTGALVVVGLLAAASGTSALGSTTRQHRELVVQLKVDHDTYLAGGERTPFLEEVHRGLLLQTKEYSVRDPRSGRERMDEQKLTDAIDRLVAMVEARP